MKNLSASARAVLRAASEGRLHRDEDGWYVKGRTASHAHMPVRPKTIKELDGLIENEAPYHPTATGIETLNRPS